MTFQQNVPHGHVNVFFSRSLGAILIWLYLEKPSISDNMVCPAVKFTIISMFGKGKSSFGHALFRSLKFVHILILLSSLDTGKILEIHST